MELHIKNLLVLASLFCGVAFADQCAYISREEASRAVLLLQKGAVVGYNCAPCGEKGIQELAVVKNVQSIVTSISDGSYSVVIVNGKEIDLAYTYIQTSPNKLVNLAKAVDCKTLDEKSVPSALKIK